MARIGFLRRTAGEQDLGKVTPPVHVAIIMDGNGRWAEIHHQPREEGHRAGVGSVRGVVNYLAKHGVRYVTLFAFSTENWSRPDREVYTLLELLMEAVRDETSALHENNVKILHIGRLDRLSSVLQDEIGRAIETTKHNTGLTLSIAFDYGGRDEIVNAVRRVVASGVSPSEIDENFFAQYLQTTDIPDPDLIVRTGGESRISNFLLWQSAYSEFYTTPVHWPDFDEKEVERALEAFQSRKRRYGSLDSTH